MAILEDMDHYFQIRKHFAHPEHPLILTDLRDIIESRRKKLYPEAVAEKEKAAENNISDDDDEEEENCSDAAAANDNDEEDEEDCYDNAAAADDDEEEDCSNDDDDGDNDDEEEEEEADLSISCKLCDNKMLESSTYSCISCDFHLHKLCAKLPKELNHPLHDPGHPLTFRGSREQFECNVCLEYDYGVGYSCYPCECHVHVGCASETQVIKHDCHPHPHPLRPFLRNALFKCDSCSTKHPDGVSYRCTTCPFWVHEDCATLPTTIKYRGHSHPLVLQRHFGIVLDCGICDERFDRTWMYKCVGCLHAVHVNCLGEKLLADMSNTYEADGDIDLTKLFHVPESFQYHDLVALMIQHMTTHNKSKKEIAVSEAGVLSHFSHQHSLTLTICDVQSPDVLSKKYKNKNNGIICNACLFPVSTQQSYYSCTVCGNNYILHEWCAKLPDEFQHPIHPHPLILRGQGHGIYGFRKCWFCWNASNGFVYECKDEDEECLNSTDLADDEEVRNNAYMNSAVDIKCACLPHAISHKSHPHPLKLIDNCFNEGCVACRYQTNEPAYGCKSCCFYLHSTCALQPITIVHRYDKHHPFILIQSPIKDGPDEYVCEFCERNVNPKWWFYHCLSCDLSACADCIFEKEQRGGQTFNPNVTYTSRVHNHPLAIVDLDHTNEDSLCSTCQTCFDCDFEAAILQCTQCNVMFHADDECKGEKYSPYPLVLQHQYPS